MRSCYGVPHTGMIIKQPHWPPPCSSRAAWMPIKPLQKCRKMREGGGKKAEEDEKMDGVRNRWRRTTIMRRGRRRITVMMPAAFHLMVTLLALA